MNPHRSPDWILIDRFLSGECSPAEAEGVRDRARADPVFAANLDSARFVRDVQRATHGRSNVDRMWRAVLAGTSAAGDPAKAHKREPPMQAVRVVPPQPSSWWRRRSFVAAAASALCLVGVASFLIADRLATERSLTTTARDYAAGPQERAAIELPDGTHVLLAPGSHLKVPSDFSRDRQANLDGEAVFTVVHNKRRPFSVRTAQTVTRDVGTAFDLQAYAETGTTRVIVTEGTVDVGGLSVQAGQAAVVTAHQPPAMIPLMHPDEDLGWTRGQLVFDATRVSDAAAIISRWFALDVRVPDSALGARHVTARFTNPSVDQVLASLTSTLNVRIDRNDRTITLLPQESKSTK